MLTWIASLIIEDDSRAHPLDIAVCENEGSPVVATLGDSATWRTCRALVFGAEKLVISIFNWHVSFKAPWQVHPRQRSQL